MTELIPTEGSLQGQRNGNSIAQLTEAIESITTVEQAKDARSVIKGFEAYAKAKQSVELVNQALELRIWTERKGGEAIINNGDKLSVLARDHRISAQDAQRWVLLYLVDEQFIRDYLSEVTENGRQISIPNLISRARDANRKRVSAGLYKELGGLYSIEWRVGRSLHKQGGFKNRQAAEKALDRNKRLASKLSSQKEKNETNQQLSKTYRYVRLALEAAEPLKATAAVGIAMDYLYRAEDALNDAVRSAGQVADK